MKRAKLVPGFTLRRKKLSVIEIAERIIYFYKKLAELDANYDQVYVVAEKKALHQSIKINAENAQLQLSEEILHQNAEEIQKMDRVENPQVDFVMNKSIVSIGLQAKTHSDTLMTLNFSFLDSKNLKSSIGSIVTSEKCFESLEKAKCFLDIARESFSVDHSVIKVFDRELNKTARSYKAPLGWITYFSNDYEIPIPDDLEGIEYEYTDKGKYLILTRENIAKDEAKLEEAKQKLLKTMQEIADRVPEYKK
ncbi:MAG: hypothetical protein WBA74_20730 [Cyclobacteriaceae bacterium]